VLLLLASGCTTASFGHRSRECDPDVRLQQLVDEYNDAKDGHAGHEGDILLDCDRVRLEMDRMAL
jgi:hypothetical protein